MDQGYPSTSIDDVARSIGSTKGRIYHHYPSKADLFFDVYRSGMNMNFDVVRPIAESPGKPAEKLLRMARAHCEAMIRTQPYQRCVWEGVEMLMRASTTPTQRVTLMELQSMREKYADIFRAVIAEAETQGTARFENLSIALQLMFMSLNSPLFWYQKRENQSPESITRVVDQCAAFALRGLGIDEEMMANV